MTQPSVAASTSRPARSRGPSRRPTLSLLPPPGYLQGRQMTTGPADLAAFDGIVLRVLSTGRVRRWTMRDGAGNTVSPPLQHSVIVNDPAAMRDAALHGLGGLLTAVPDVLPALSDGSLVRLLPDWCGDAGSITVH
ncbi:MAG: LysR substrate-binding domain-containing protein [Devosia sp.]